MPFPNVNRAPTAANSCRTPNAEERAKLFSRISTLARRFELDDIVPMRSAAVAYLGLCRMKQANDEGRNEDIRQLCSKLTRELQPEVSGSTVNCAWFTGNNDRFLDHRPIIKNALGIYLPVVRSSKKGGLILLAIGCMHDDSVPIPQDDSWIKSYIF